MKNFKFILVITLTVLLGGFIALVILKRKPKIITEIIPRMMKICEKMMSSGKFPMDCCKHMMEKHCK
jgi:hypothetical protein